MKLVFTILLLSLTSVQLIAQDEKEYKSKKDKRAFYESLVKKYGSEDQKYIWSTDKGDEFAHYVDGDKESELVDDFSTVLHELFHGICKSVDDGQNYMINKDLMIYVPYTKVFPSSDLNQVVRKGQQDSIYRYGIYVGGKNGLYGQAGSNKINTKESNTAASIKHGIYGLMEEFAAYGVGIGTSLKLYDYFMDKFGKDNEDAWYDFRHMVEDDEVAYYEFHFFMGSYLVNAKKNHPDIYKDIMENKAFKIVYTLTENKFKESINLYNEKLKNVPRTSYTEIYGKLDFSGSDLDIVYFLELSGQDYKELYKEVWTEKNGLKEKNIEIILSKEEIEFYRETYEKYLPELQKDVKGDMDFYFAFAAKTRPYLKRQLTKEMEEELNNLYVKDCNESNYKNYMK